MRKRSTIAAQLLVRTSCSSARSGRFATADADLRSLSYGIPSGTQRALLGAGNRPVADGLLAGELASSWAKAAVCAGATRGAACLPVRSEAVS